MPTATKKVRQSNEEAMELRKGPWTIEEDSMLIHYIACHGEGRWNLLAKCAGKEVLYLLNTKVLCFIGINWLSFSFPLFRTEENWKKL